MIYSNTSSHIDQTTLIISLSSIYLSTLFPHNKIVSSEKVENTLDQRFLLPSFKDTVETFVLIYPCEIT